MSRINEVLLVIRRGDIKLQLPNVEQRANGTLWCQGNPILDSEAAGAPERSALVNLSKTKQYTKIPDSCFARRGENPSGLLVLTESEWEARPEQVAKRAARKAIDDAIFEREYAVPLAEARRTGKPAVVQTWVTERCMNHNHDECSFDAATQTISPTGKLKIEYVCCY